jgi:hypothetical protein
VATEVANSDPVACGNETTTVARNYGQRLLEDSTPIGLYGTPGPATLRLRVGDSPCRLDGLSMRAHGKPSKLALRRQ